VVSNNSSSSYTNVLRRLDLVRRKENRLALLDGALIALFVAIVAVGVVVGIEQLFAFDVLGRSILAGIATLAIFSAIAWYVVRPFLRLFGILPSASNEHVARTVGTSFPAIHDRLLDALQVYEAHDATRYSAALIDASFGDLYRHIEPLDFRQAVSTTGVRRMGKYTAYALGALVFSIIVSPGGFFGSAYRLLHFSQTFATPLPIEFVVEPGNVEVVRGDDVPVTIRTKGKSVGEITLNTRQHGQLDFDKTTLKASAEGTFTTSLKTIRASTEYFAEAENVRSSRFTLTVLDRPMIRSLQVKVTPPAYTRLPARMLEDNSGDVSAYPGSTIDFELAASKELASAALVFNDGSTKPLTLGGSSARGTISARTKTSYHLRIKDRDGLPNIDPIEYTITLIPDEFPTVEILSPARNVDLTESMKLDCLLRLKDDFGFSKLRLAYRLAQSRYEPAHDEYSFIDIPLPSKRDNAIDTWYQWDLAPLRLVPEDAYAYYVEVFDNDNVNGPKSGKSEIFLVRLPSLEELYTDVGASQNQSMQSMESVAKEAQQLKRDIDDLQREMRTNREKADWQQQKKAEEMMKRFEQMKQKLDETAKTMEEMVNQMEENKLLSEQTLQKYQELQQLMEKLNSPELQEALKKLQESMKKLSPEEMKQAIEQLKFTEEQFRQSLERTIDLLKRIAIEQKVDEMIKRAEELAQELEKLREQTAKTNPVDQQKRDELAKQQESLQQQAESLQQQAQDLQQRMEEFPKEMPVEEMAEANQQLQESQMQEAMQQAQQQMQSGNMQSAQQKQQQAQQSAQQFGQQMQQVQQSMRDKQMEQIVNHMRKDLQDVLELSRQQEDLKSETKELNPNSQRFRENAQRQHEIMNDLGNVAGSMSELAKKTFAVSPEMGKEIGNAMKQMGEAMQQMENRNPGSSSEKQNEAMGSLNRAAMRMQGALAAMMEGGEGSMMGMGGLMAALRQMSGQQQGINEGTQSAMGQGNGQGLTPQQQAAYGRLAGAQGSVQKSLQELAREAKDAGEFSKLLGDLDQIARDMQEVQTNLEQGNVNPETLQKQERILSRLLDSQRSMRERDYEKRRRAETGQNVRRTSPAEIDLTTQEGRNRLREELLKVREGKYSKDYEELIRKYFEQLEKEGVGQ
jgi:hypothetical protein